jgi:hypothetical protein
VYSPGPPGNQKEHDYFVRNLDLLLAVTGQEDFTLMAEIQQSMASGGLDRVVYGRIEPPLIHFHNQIDLALASVE